MQITLKDILTTYWAQTVLLAASIGFILKRILDLRTKKIETKQGLFQQNRNAVIMRFMESYIGLQGLYRQVLNSKFDSRKIEEGDFVQTADDKWEQLYSNYFYFKLFLDPLEQARYADLMTEMRNIFAIILDTSVKLPTGDKALLMDGLRNSISEKLKVNNDNIKMIGKFFRENAAKHDPIQIA